MWRPKEWDATEILEKAKIENPLFSHRYSCEAGVDAILEALKEGYTFWKIHDKKWYTNRHGGTWVFIPDEDVK